MSTPLAHAAVGARSLVSFLEAIANAARRTRGSTFVVVPPDALRHIEVLLAIGPCCSIRARPCISDLVRDCARLKVARPRLGGAVEGRAGGPSMLGFLRHDQLAALRAPAAGGRTLGPGGPLTLAVDGAVVGVARLRFARSVRMRALRPPARGIFRHGVLAMMRAAAAGFRALAPLAPRALAVMIHDIREAIAVVVIILINCTGAFVV